MDGRGPSSSGSDPPQGCGPLLPSESAVSLPLRQQVFEQVRASGQTARADITRALSISPGSVTQATSELIAGGLLTEVVGPARETGRGRPPVMLEVVGKAGMVAGIKLSDTQHSAVLLDFAGRQIADVTLPASALKRPAEAVISEVGDLLGRLEEAAGLGALVLDAIGIGLPGLVDAPGGGAVWSPLLDAPAPELAADLAARHGAPVHLDNDVNLLTLAELWFGAGRGLSDFAVVTIEQGVGMGLVIGNRLFRGAGGLGMELGHTKVQLDGALCRCGQRGCLEAYVADYALVREATTALGLPPSATHDPAATLEALYTHAQSGHAAARAIFARAGRYLAVGLSNVLQLFDPKRVILSGARMRYEFLYATEVMTEMAELTLDRARPATPVEPHAWGDLIWARGASALALDKATEARIGEALANA